MSASDHDRTNELFDAIHQERDAIEETLGANLQWKNDPRYRSSRIFWSPEGACGYRSPTDERQAGFEVLADAMYRFHDTLIPYVERLA